MARYQKHAVPGTPPARLSRRASRRARDGEATLLLSARRLRAGRARRRMIPAMQVICSCGKKLFFGEDPNEEQVCDRCGQKVRASGPVADRRKDRPGAKGGTRTPLPARAGEPQGFETALRRSPVPRPGEDTGDLLPGRIASEHRRSRLGCVLVPVFLAGAAVGADFLLRPPGALPCGHKGKADYLFGLVPGHSCPGLEALRYLDRVRRRALLQTEELPRSFRELVGGKEELAPPTQTPYTFDIADDGALVADPIDGSPGLSHYRLEREGTVRCEESERAGPSSLQTGSF